MVDMYFFGGGSTHSLRLLYRFDLEVWEGLVDNAEYFYFEADRHLNTWPLYGLAAQMYEAYRENTNTEKIDWKQR